MIDEKNTIVRPPKKSRAEMDEILATAARCNPDNPRKAQIFFAYGHLRKNNLNDLSPLGYPRRDAMEELLGDKLNQEEFEGVMNMSSAESRKSFMSGQIGAW